MLSVAERAAEVMEHLCEHSAHGYSQPNRAGVGTGGSVGETITLSDGTRVGISGGDRDCSSACVECYAAQGVDCGGASYTGNMRSCMTKTGNFRWHAWGSYDARRGDIYLSEGHHAAMCLGGGRLGEFSRSEKGTAHGSKGDQDGWESHVRGFYQYSKGWDGVLQYVGDGSLGTSASGSPGRPAGALDPKQSILLHDAYFGPLTAKHWQARLRKAGYYPASKYVIDGDFGYYTKLETQYFLRDHGYYPASKYLMDGEFEVESIKALQQYLLDLKVYWSDQGWCLVDGDWADLTTIAVQRAVNAGVLFCEGTVSV